MHQRIKALLLSAHPSSPSAKRSELDEKRRMVRDELGDIQNIVFGAESAESIVDIQNEFAYHPPHIVHFIGNSAGKGIALPNHPGDAQTVKAGALTKLFSTSGFNLRIRLIILDRGCYLPEQAKALTKNVIDYVIGIPDHMHSGDAQRFTIALYSAINQGALIKEAFKQACEKVSSSAVLPELLSKSLVKEDTPLLPRTNAPEPPPHVEVKPQEEGNATERRNGSSPSHLELEMSQMIHSSSLSSSSPKPQSRYSTRELDPLVSAQDRALLKNVFVRTEEPTLTFVESEDFRKLQQVLKEKKRALIMQGPSGIGKTTAVCKILESMQATFLSARNPEHCNQLEAIQIWHDGLLIIDDFHYIDAALGQKIVAYLVALADPKQGTNNKRGSKQLVLVGSVPNGQGLVALPASAATNVEVLTWSKVSDSLVWEMITRGENALNINLKHEDKENLVMMADGSLNLAQILCYYTCFLAKVLTEEEQLRTVSCDITSVITTLKADLTSNFGNVATHFAALGPAYNNNFSLYLLKELAASDNGLLSLAHLEEQQPKLSSDIERFVNEMWLETLYREHPDSRKYFFFNYSTATLITDNPLFRLYLQHLSWKLLAEEAKKKAITTGQKVLIYHNHHPARTDIKWLSEFKVCLMSLGYGESIVEQDITIITTEIEGAQGLRTVITPARAVILFVSREFLAANAIINQMQRPMLQALARGTAIIPIIVEPCSFEKSQLAVFPPANPSSKSLEQITGRANRGEALVKLAEEIHNQLS